MVCYHHIAQVPAFSQAASNGKHYSITEGYAGGFHILRLVMSFRDCFGSIKQGGTEVIVHKAQGNNQVLYPQVLAILPGTFYFSRGVIATIVKGYCQGDALPVFVQEGNRIHPAGKDNNTILFRGIFLHIVEI